MATLSPLLDGWKRQLSSWAQEGSISRAAVDALQLKEEPKALKELMARWAAGQFQDLPPVVTLPASSMAGAAGAYAISTGTIYLNQEWLRSASQAQALAVLTEELGHHLDGQLNASDTPGDEGELFAAHLQREGLISEPERLALQAEDDRGRVLVAGQELEVEQAKVISIPIPIASPGRTAREWRNGTAFAALKSDGSVITWGHPINGGDSSRVASQLRSGFTQIFSTGRAFAALKSDGSVITWGNFYVGGDSSGVASQLRSGVTQIFSTSSAFAALKSDGSVITWGYPSDGGDSSRVASQLRSGVTQIFSTDEAFAALKSDGSVITWGEGEDGDSSRVASQLRSGVTQIFSNEYAFAALKRDGSVITWGSFYLGGDSFRVANQLRSGVTQIFSTERAFAALKRDGSVITWGDFYEGGDSSGVASQLRSGVTQIFSNDEAFAALKSDGSVITWGSYGGDSSSVASQLSSGVTQIFSTDGAFAALKSNGSVITWGQYFDTNKDDNQLVSGVTQISSTWSNFAALKSDGSVVALGGSHAGDTSSVASQLSSGVTQIFSNRFAFAALKSDGSVITWGNPSDGGDSSIVASQLRSGVVAFANPFTDDRLVGDAGPPAVLSLAAAKASQAEGNSGFTPFLFTVTRTGNTSGVSTATWAIDAGGDNMCAGVCPPPANATDFKGGAFPSGTLTFAAGATSKTVTVNVVGDTTAETNESFRLTLSAPTGASLHPTDFRSTGTILNDDVIGTAANDTRKGTSLPEFIDGRQGRDTLTGGGARDVFGFSYGHSTIPAPDRITDFQFGVDRIDLLTAAGSALPAPTAFSRASNNSTARTLSDLAAAVFRDANGAVAGNQALGANRAALVVATRAPIAGTYLFINDGNAARNNSNDLLINITGFTGALPGLGGIPVSTVFA